MPDLCLNYSEDQTPQTQITPHSDKSQSSVLNFLCTSMNHEDAI